MSEPCAEVLLGLFCGVFPISTWHSSLLWLLRSIKIGQTEAHCFHLQCFGYGASQNRSNKLLFICSFSQQRPLQAALNACPAFGAAFFSSGLLASVSLGQWGACLVILWDSRVSQELFCLESFISLLLSQPFNPRLLTIHCCWTKLTGLVKTVFSMSNKSVWSGCRKL